MTSFQWDYITKHNIFIFPNGELDLHLLVNSHIHIFFKLMKFIRFEMRYNSQFQLVNQPSTTTVATRPILYNKKTCVFLNFTLVRKMFSRWENCCWLGWSLRIILIIRSSPSQGLVSSNDSSLSLEFFHLGYYKCQCPLRSWSFWRDIVIQCDLYQDI